MHMYMHMCMYMYRGTQPCVVLAVLFDRVLSFSAGRNEVAPLHLGRSPFSQSPHHRGHLSLLSSP